MTPLYTKARLVFLIAFFKWYFSKYWQVRIRRVFAQTVTYVCYHHPIRLLSLLYESEGECNCLQEYCMSLIRPPLNMLA